MSEPHRFFGIDLGYGWTKTAVATITEPPRTGSETLIGRLAKHPTAVARVANTTMAMALKPGQNGFISLGGDQYVVGELAVHSANCRSGRDLAYMQAYGPLLLFEAIRRWSETPHDWSGNVIGVGLPPADFTSQRERFASFLSAFTINDTPIENEIHVYPQGAVPLVEWMARGGATKNVVMLDVGHNTVDVIPVRDGHLLADESGTIDRAGMCRVLDRLGGEIRIQFHAVLSAADLVDVLRTEEVSIRGRVHNVADIIHDIVREYSQWLFDQVRERWGAQLATAQHVITFGGGTYALEQAPWDEVPFVALDQPEYANAKGYLALASQRRVQFVY